MLQIAPIILDPNIVIVTILDRFGLFGYPPGAFLHSTYEGPQLSSMVEEALYLFATIFSEHANPSKLPIAGCIRREIIPVGTYPLRV